MAGILQEAIVPPLGTLLMQFAPLLDSYFGSADIWFLRTSVHQTPFPIKLNKFLSKMFVIMFEDLIGQNSDFTGNLKVPELSLFDIPHILTPNRLISQ